MISAMLVACVLAANPEAAPSSASPDIAAYKDAKAKVGRDADAHVRLALWCEARGMVAERTKHLTIATLIDPANATARGLLGMVQYQGKWLSPDAVGERIQADPEKQAKIREYLERRVKAADKPDDQMKLALWCDQNDLKDQATAHFHRAVQLDPGRELAWKHLGYKKEKRRWVKPEQAAAEKAFHELQTRANKHWKPILEKLRHGLSSHSTAERAKAEASLAEIKDPAAVPAVWLTFAQGDAKRQEVAVKLFGQIDAPGASKALAMLAIMSPSQDVRRDAVQLLKRKDPRDFADVLISMIRKPIEYEVRSRVGENHPGELFIKGSNQNLRRLFSAMTMPEFPILAGDQLIYDDQGRPVIQRSLGGPMGNRAVSGQLWNNGFLAGSAYSGLSINSTPANPAPITNALAKGGLPSTEAAQLGQTIANNLNSPVNRLFTAMSLDPMGIYGLNPYPRLDIPVGQMRADVQRSTEAAQAQLDGEVKQLEDYNRPIRDVNRNARQLLADTAGVDLGDDPEKWRNWLVDMQGFAVVPVTSSKETPTTVEDAAIDFVPSVDPRIIELARISHSACFAAGTPVRTIDGPRPIETLKAGDRVLTQNTSSGRIGFTPVLNPIHNPPNETLKIRFDSREEPIVATGIHRFWKVGEGWAMARDLKPGDVLRAIGGVAKVSSIEPDTKQPVFNLRVAEGESFFVGDLGVLAHDNSLVQPSDKPFDRVDSRDKAADRK